MCNIYTCVLTKVLTIQQNAGLGKHKNLENVKIKNSFRVKKKFEYLINSSINFVLNTCTRNIKKIYIKVIRAH